MPGAIGYRGASWSLTARNSVERWVASAIRNRGDSRFLDIVDIPSNTIYSTTVWYHNTKVCPCTAVITVVSHTTLFFSRSMCYIQPDLKKSLSLLCSELALEGSVVLSGRAVSKNSCNRDRCLFEEALRELMHLIICGGYLTEGI